MGETIKKLDNDTIEITQTDVSTKTREQLQFAIDTTEGKLNKLKAELVKMDE